jgi:hypothetical protein
VVGVGVVVPAVTVSSGLGTALGPRLLCELHGVAIVVYRYDLLSCVVLTYGWFCPSQFVSYVVRDRRCVGRSVTSFPCCYRWGLETRWSLPLLLSLGFGDALVAPPVIVGAWRRVGRSPLLSLGFGDALVAPPYGSGDASVAPSPPPLLLYRGLKMRRSLCHLLPCCHRWA